MKEYDETKYITVSKKVVTFHKICLYLIEILGTLILVLVTALVFLWASLQVLLMIISLI